jgi:hypothetical protein
MQVLTYEVSDALATITKVIVKAKEGGVDIDGTNEGGKISAMGIEATYKIEKNKITISVEKKPFFLTDDKIKNELDKFFGMENN